MLDQQISTKLYNAIAAAEKPRPMERWHASQLAQCPRAQYMQRQNVAPVSKPTAAKILRWQAGHAIEEAIRPRVLDVYGRVNSNERYDSLNWDLTGELDNYAINQQALVEIKSVHDFAFVSREGVTYLKEDSGRKNLRGKAIYMPKNTPYLHHEYQQHAYALLLKEKQIPLKHIDYVYVSLSGRIVTYHTPVRPSLIEWVKERLNQLNAAWKAGLPPLCECNEHEELWGAVYQWCPYRTENSCCGQVRYE